MRRISLAAFGIAVFLAAAGARAELPADPLASPMWKEMAAKEFAGGRVAFDPRVKVSVPHIVENQAQVPVTVDARGVEGITKLVVFADLNPIQHVLTLHPQGAAPYIAFRMKVEQSTPVRAAALTQDGVWHVGGIMLDAAGGGCTAAALARNDADWTETLGQAQGKTWREVDGTVRARFRVRHPMDTGLAKNNTPAYFIENVEVRGSENEPLARLEMFEPVAEDPTLTLRLRLPPSDTAVEIEGRDNNGGTYKMSLPAPGRQSLLRDVGAGLARAPC